MTAEDIRNICIDSASKYYNFLEENDKGLQEVNVFEMTRVAGGGVIYKLKLASKLFDLDSIFFKLYHNNTLYTIDQIKVIEYDVDKHTLLIKPGEQLEEMFTRLSARDIKVISDLKFLVARIKSWYELNGAKVALPNKISVLNETVSEIGYLSGSEPSQNQKDALNTIFQNSFSYIWGAPGTGKTQFVLSYAILHYLRNDKKVAVLAPTNNALEQVLRGVIKMLDKGGIERTKLLRLGTPSRRFAEEFPEVCEEKGVMKKIEEIVKQISILEKVININIKIDGLKEADKSIELFSSFLPMQEKLKDSILTMELRHNQYNASLDKQHNLQREISFKQSLRDKQERKVNSTFSRLRKTFSSKLTGAEIQLVKYDEELTFSQEVMTKLTKEVKDKEISLNVSKLTVKQEEKKIDGLINLIKAKFLFSTAMSTILSNLNGNNWFTIKDDLKRTIGKETAELQAEMGLAESYHDQSPDMLKLKLDRLKRLKEKFASHSTEERLKSVNVVAYTLDGYVGRHTDVKMDVDHIFMDEAGYSNIIKALTLFNHNVPVTFLGDHMQLPPVCELNDMDIERNLDYNNIFLWSQSAIFLEGLFGKSRDAMLVEYLKNVPLVNNSMKRADLRQTYRFGQNLSKILDKHVYKNEFSSLNTHGDTRLFYIHANKEDGIKSRTSINEVMGIKSLVDQFDRENEDFVILTPYKKQLTLIGQFLPHERNELKILTVHGSQGREWDTVILSVADTGDKWFVDSLNQLSKGLNLLNTALSRARKRLIIVCDTRYWNFQNGQLITDLLRESEQISVVN